MITHGFLVSVETEELDGKLAIDLADTILAALEARGDILNAAVDYMGEVDDIDQELVLGAEAEQENTIES